MNNKIDITNKKYIIFDMDGTLIDSIGVWNYADKKLILDHSNKDIDENTIMNERHKFLENNTSKDIYIEYCKYLIEKYDFDIKDVNKIIEERRKFSNEILANEIEFKEGVVELIKILKEKGLILVLATITTKNQIDIYNEVNKKMTSKMKIKEVFDTILTKDDVIHKKPNPEIYLKVLEKYNADPSECLVFEDSLHGVIAAKDAKIETVNIYDKYSDSDREKLNELSTYKINSFYELIDYLK